MNTDISDVLNQVRKSNTEYFSSLNSALAQGIMNKDEVQTKISMKRKDIIKKHEANFSIWQGEGKDNRWKTRLPNGKLIAKTQRPDLDDAIVDFYCEPEKLTTLSSLYAGWIKYKAKETSQANAKRLSSSYKKYLDGSSIISLDIKTLKVIDIKTWLLDQLDEKEFTKKQYMDMKTIINQLLDYAVDYSIIQHNPAREIHNISYKHFKETPVKPVEEQVYFPNEVVLYLAECDRMYAKTKNMAYLATAMNTNLGLRIGELSAIEKDCFDNDFLYVKRQEVVKWTEENDTWKRDGYIISDHLKTQQSVRRLALTSTARKYIELALAADTSSPFLFTNANGERLSNDSIRSAQRRVNNHIGTAAKGNHSLRKTYASILKSSNQFSPETIQAAMGHKDFSTTQTYYCYPLERDTETLNKFESALSFSVTECNTKIVSFSERKKSRNPA